MFIKHALCTRHSARHTEMNKKAEPVFMGPESLPTLGNEGPHVLHSPSEKCSKPGVLNCFIGIYLRGQVDWVSAPGSFPQSVIW